MTGKEYLEMMNESMKRVNTIMAIRLFEGEYVTLNDIINSMNKDLVEHDLPPMFCASPWGDKIGIAEPINFDMHDDADTINLCYNLEFKKW